MRKPLEGLAESLKLKRQFFENQREAIAAQAVLLAAALKRGNQLISFGNGGSAGDTLRMTACLVRRGFRATALPSYANLDSDPCSFAELYRVLRRPGDCALAISTTGNSPNIVQAATMALNLGDPVIALTGRDGGRLRTMVPDALCVPSDSTQRIQEVHLMLVHELATVALSILHE